MLSAYDTVFILIHLPKLFVPACKFQHTKMLLGKSTPILLTSWFHILVTK